MMLVDTFVAPSAIEGVGIFAAEFIPAGTCIWRFDRRFDQVLARNQVADLADPQRRFISRYGYPLMTDPGYIVLESDNGRFMNHSSTPNTDFRDETYGYAIADIPPETEITCDYGEFEPNYDMQPGRSFTAIAQM